MSSKTCFSESLSCKGLEKNREMVP